MKRARRTFTREFKMKAVKMLENRGDRTIESIAKDLDIHTNLLIKWRDDFAEHAERTFLGSNDVLNELERLRKENEDLKIDREILKKALAIFSRQKDK